MNLLTLILLLGICLVSAATAQETRGAAPTVTTRGASALGLGGMTVSGSIQPHGLPTTYYVEYGPTTAYGEKMAALPLGPRLAAYYRESWDDGHGGWFGGLMAKALVHHREGGVGGGGFVRFSEPDPHDRNHDDGIGTLHLPTYAYPGPLGAQSLGLGGGDPDLRDAKVSLYVRGNEWEPNGSELLWWTQSQSNIERLHEPGWQRANWAYTGFTLTDALRSGRWEKVEYRLWNDAALWSYAGNNTAQKGSERYSYWPINESQRHLNCNFFHLLAFVSPANPPTGSIDFDEFELAYRNYSLLLPSNGGRLKSAPKSPDDPSTLTDGWRHGPGRAWRSAENPSGPLEFLYAFQLPVTIRSVQLHQNPDWPARAVEVLASQDGASFATLLKRTMPEKGVPGANQAFTLDKGLSAKASFLKVRILSGYRTPHWGLGEIEAFGDGATMLTDDDLYCVNTDIQGLKSGVTYHYRLVAANSAGVAYGADATFTASVDARPQATTGRASRITATTAQVDGRLNPMGQRTQFHFEYGPDERYGLQTAPAYGGLQITPRSVQAVLTGLRPGAACHYRLVAVNELGVTRGQDAVLRTLAE